MSAVSKGGRARPGNLSKEVAGELEADSEGPVSLQQWLEWKQKCDSNLCGVVTKVALRRFGFYMFNRFLPSVLADTRRSDVVSPDKGEVKPLRSWLLFETHLVADQTKLGKSYKDWLFKRLETSSDDPMKVIVGGARDLMRDVVRHYVRSEKMYGNARELDAPVSRDGEDDSTLMDLLPEMALLNRELFGDSTRNQVIMNEYNEMAQKQASLYFAKMTLRQKLAVLADALNVSLANPEVTRLADCGKGGVYEAFTKVAQELKSILDKAYTSEQALGMKVLYELSTRNITELCLEWGRRPENGCARIFLLQKT